MHIRFVQKFIDILRGRKSKSAYNYVIPVIPAIKDLRKNHSDVKNFLKKQIKQGEKIKVCFSVIFDSIFPAKPLFEKMLKDELFEPFILVIPDTLRDEENMFYQMGKTYNKFSAEYKDKVFYAYDFKKKQFVDYSDKINICIFANPYNSMTNELYSIEYSVKNGILPIYISYGTMPDYYAREHIINLRSLNLCWKVFVDTKENMNDVVKYTDLKGKNAILSGYCKMDDLDKIDKKDLEREKIIIAPHHTVDENNFGISNFLKYADFFLELPKLYPQIDFVFRPHPLLFVALSKENLWGKQRVEEYTNKITSFPNIEYQNGGDYFETFVNSSALIHDCSSFVMEYLYSGHPACYMLKSKEEIEEVFAPIGQQCLKNHYHAFNKDDIINFIEDVVLSKNDPLKDKRIEFAKEKIMVNYPNVSDFIMNNLKEDLK